MATLPQLVPFQVPNFNLGETYTQLARLSAYDAQRRASELEQEEKRGKLDRDRLWRSTIAEAFPTTDPRAPGGLTSMQPQAQAPPAAPVTGGLAAPQPSPQGPAMAGPQPISQGPSLAGPQGMASQVPTQQWMDVNPQTGEWSTPLDRGPGQAGGLSAPPTSPMAAGGAPLPPGATAGPPPPGTGASLVNTPTGPPGASAGTTGWGSSAGTGWGSRAGLGAPQPTQPLEALVPGLMPMPDMRAVQRAFAIDPEKTAQWYGAYLTQRKTQLDEVTRNNELVHQVTGAMLENPAYYQEGLAYLREQGVPVPKNMPAAYNPALVKMHFDLSGKRLDPLQEAHRQAYLADAAYKKQQGLTEAADRETVERFRARQRGESPGAAQPAGGAAPPTPGPQASAADTARWQSLLQLADETADREGVPRALVRAVIKQESNWDINAVGDGGKARGWFQLHEGAAKDAGIDPARRHEPELNVQGGIRYLALKLKQAGGDVDKALRLYNGGGDPNYVQNVRRWMKEEAPAVARTAPETSMMVAGGTGAPAPPTARSTPEQDAAYRASRGEPPPATTTTAAAPAVPAATSARMAQLRQQIAAKQQLANEASTSPRLAGAATQLRSEITDMQQELARLEEPQRAAEKETATTRAKQVLERERQAQPMLPEDRRKLLTGLRSDIRQEPTFKIYQDVRNGYQNVQVGAKRDSAEGDLAIIYGLAKILDPGSVVRESEFATVAAAQGKLQQLLNTPQRFFEGDRLTPANRQKLLSMATSLSNEKLTTAQKELRAVYEPLAKEGNIDFHQLLPLGDLKTPEGQSLLEDMRSGR